MSSYLSLRDAAIIGTASLASAPNSPRAARELLRKDHLVWFLAPSIRTGKADFASRSSLQRALAAPMRTESSASLSIGRILGIATLALSPIALRAPTASMRAWALSLDSTFTR